MADKNKIRFGWLAFTFVILHFGAIFLFALPDNWINKDLKSGIGSYVNPIFYQKWNIFAPCPVINGKLYAEYEFKDGTNSGTIRPAQEALELHKSLYFTHHGDIVIGESNVLYFLYYDMVSGGYLKDDTTAFDGLPHSSEGFKKMHRFSLGMGDYLFEKEVTSVNVICDFTNVKTGEFKVAKFSELKR